MRAKDEVSAALQGPAPCDTGVFGLSALGEYWCVASPRVPGANAQDIPHGIPWRTRGLTFTDKFNDGAMQ